jgi:type II secretory pathway pseudopilin PulG
MFNFFSKKGMTVVETVVAVGIFAILSTVAYEIYIGVDNLVKRADQKSTALWLAEEGIEAVRSIRDENFTSLADGTYGLSASGNKWVLAGSSDVVDNYTRVLNISTISANEKDVLATISWNYKTQNNSLSLNSRLTNWHKVDYNAGLTVEKVIINHGGNATSTTFAPYTVSITVGTSTTDTVVEAGATNQFMPGTYTVTETADPNYTQSFDLDCNALGEVTVATSSTKVCRIINEEKPAKLRVNKTVINHGNSKVVSDFSLRVDSNPVTSGALNTFDSGVHTVSEVVDAEYDTTIGGDCNSGGLVTLVPNVTRTCSVTNEEKLSYVTVYKNIINHGGTAVTADFAPYKVGATTVTLGATTTKNSGTYTVTETVDPAYTQTFSGDCNGSGSITLIGGMTKTCTITNEENFVVPTVTIPTVTSITQTTATLGATVASLGVPHSISARGTCWGTTSNPVTNCVAEGGTTTGVFTQARTGFTAGTTYYYRGYATNSTGTGYSADGTFTTLTANVVPTVTTPTATAITSNSATLGADVTSLGIPATITARGTCYGTTPNPVTNCVAEGGTTTGVFTQARTGFTAGTTYYYRGYATNSTGTGYSADGMFATVAICSVAAATVGTPTTYDNAGSVSAVVAKPTGVTQGDIMFAQVFHFNSTDRFTTTPAGWTEIGRHKNGNYNQALLYRVATAGEGGVSNYTFSLVSSSKLAVTISAYRGCFDIANPIDSFSNVEYVVNNTTYRAGSINLSAASTTVLMFPSVYNGSVRTFSPPLTQGGGWTEDHDHGTNTADFSRAGYRKFISSAGATGVIDSIGNSNNNAKHAFAVGLHRL